MAGKPIGRRRTAAPAVKTVKVLKGAARMKAEKSLAQSRIGMYKTRAGQSSTPAENRAWLKGAKKKGGALYVPPKKTKAKPIATRNTSGARGTRRGT